jgi:predicted phage terminase large subunit-like protein
MAKLPASTKSKILERAAAARSDFSLFIELVWRYTPMKHQRAWIKELEKVVAGEIAELLIVAPRGAGKSAMFVLFLAWMIGNNPTKHYGLLSYSDKIAWRRSRAIRNIIEFDPVYHLIFPEVKPDMSNWSRESFTVMRTDKTDLHPTLIAAGSTAAVISSRLDGAVYDDPHDEKNTKTPAKRRAVVETWDQAISPCLQAEAWVVCIATRYADDDLPGIFINRGFKTIHQRAITQSYKKGRKPARKKLSYAPSLASLAFLKEKEDRNPLAFALQYQGDTTGGTAAVIKRLVTYQAKELPELTQLLIQAGTDTNYKEGEESDYTVIYIGGLDKSGNVWMLHREKGRWDVDDLANLIVDLHRTWRYTTNWIEDTAKGTPAVTMVRKKAAFVPCELQPASRGGKRSRASSIASHLNSGQVKWPANAEWFRDAEYYLTHYGHTDQADDLDALYMLLSNILQAIHPSSYGAGRPKRRVTIGGGRKGWKKKRGFGRR